MYSNYLLRVLLVFTFLFCLENDVKSQTRRDSVEIYNPFIEIDKVREIVRDEFSTLDPKNKALLDSIAKSLKQETLQRKIAGLYVRIGDIYYRKGIYYLALQHFQKAEEIFENQNDLNNSAKVKIKLARAYLFSDFIPQLDYVNLALMILNKSNEKQNIALAAYLSGLKENNPAKKKELFNKAVSIQVELVKKDPRDAEIKEYYAVFLNAIDRIEEAIKIANEINNKHLLVVYLNNLGYKFVLSKKYDEGLEIFKRSLRICIEEGLKTLTRNTTENIARAYRLKGNWEKAANYQQLMHIFEENIFSERNLLKAEEYRIKYESDKKEIENSFLKKEQNILADSIKIQKTLNLLLILSIIAVVSFLVWLFINNRKLKIALNLLDTKNLELEELYSKKNESEKNLKEAQATAHLANWVYDPSKQSIVFSEEAEKIILVTDLLSSEKFTTVLDSIIIDDRKDKVKQFFLGVEFAAPVNEIEFQIDFNGSHRWIKAKRFFRQEKTKDSLKVIGTIQDVTDTKENERIKHEIHAQLKYTKQLIKSIEDERKRIANELHDGLGQDVLLIKNRALLGLQSTVLDEKTKMQFTEIDKSVSSVLDSVREISMNLRPAHLERLGLTETVLGTISKYETNGFIEIHSSVEDIDGLMGTDSELHFYRIIQEALNNIIKHSNAKEAFVEIIKDSNGINLLIKDDGKGFEIDSTLESSEGFGLKNIYNRVMLLDGSIEIKSKLRKGTTIEIVIPYGKLNEQ